MKKSKSALVFIFVLLIGFLGVGLRFYNIEFGLPHSFYADEPEITELAIKYTYEIRSIIANNDYYKLIPISFVYGTFPVYIFWIAVMGYSKLLNILNIPFDKTELFIFMRIVNASISLLLIPTVYLIYTKLFPETTKPVPNKDRLKSDKSVPVALTCDKICFGSLFLLFLLLLNWKFIAHAHYVNPDILLTTFIWVSIYFLHKYHQKSSSSWYVVLTGIFFGLAYGTKITALISFPLFCWVFIWNKDYRSLFGFIFWGVAAFMLSNPFAVIFTQDFGLRIYEMLAKEGGLVFDSVDYSPIKYIAALNYILSWPVFILFILGLVIWIRKTFFLTGKLSFNKIGISDENKDFFILFLTANLFVYLLFFSVQSRRVDRWILPVIPIAMMFASYGFTNIADFFKKLLTDKTKQHLLFVFYVGIISTIYLYYPYLLTKQLNIDTPKSSAYKWLQKNSQVTDKKLGYTFEGLDPMNKLPNSFIRVINVYENEGAALFYPINPLYFDYVIVTARSMENYKKPEVADKYPNYNKKWSDYENLVSSSDEFSLIKDFVLPKPDLLPLSDVFIYKNNSPALPEPATGVPNL